MLGSKHAKEISVAQRKEEKGPVINLWWWEMGLLYRITEGREGEGDLMDGYVDGLIEKIGGWSDEG